jgi:phosphatidylinositol alpha-1,6-mannosyltransferase
VTIDYFPHSRLAGEQRKAVTARPGTDVRVLLLAPSSGRGGGIERYVQTLEWAFASRSVTCRRLDLSQPGAAGHWQLLTRASDRAPGDRGPVRVVAAHRALLPVALAVQRRRAVSGISVICHGSDVWGPSSRPRWWLERRALRGERVRVVAVSDFTAGAVGVACQATVLTPGLSRPWFDELRAAGAGDRRPREPGALRLVTAFRLDDWRDKGLPELLAALRRLGRPGLTLTICGSGTAPAELGALVARLPWCQLRCGLADAALARELAAADLFVLATRTRSGRRPTGEGFGLVLLEAQLAGVPVVGPASGGSRDAYLDGVTGAAPVDESAAALARTLSGLLADPARLALMGRAAGRWAQERYDPDLYAAQAVAALL